MELAPGDDRVSERQELVIAPGGPRSAETVQWVPPGHVVRRGPDGSYSLVPESPTEIGEEAMPEDLVLTPGGLRPASLVHEVPAGHTVDETGGRVQVHDPSGAVVRDLGVVARRPEGVPLMPANVAHPPAVDPSFGSGWIAYASWSNNTGKAANFFATTWTVPPAPATSSGQTIFLFNGIQNSTMIYQPVLQWGSSAAGGGAYWAVACWYVDGQGGSALHSTLVRVNPGDTLVGIMKLTGQSPQGFSYSSEFEGIANTSLAIQNVEQLTWLCETLECYGITKCSDYPSGETQMKAIKVETGNSHPAMTWTATNAVTDCGQHATVVSSSSTDGEVDLFYATPGAAWAGLGGVLTSDIAAGRNADGRLEVFVRGTDNGLYHIWQTTAGGGWSGWAGLGGGLSGDPAVARNADGRLEVFVAGGGGQPNHIWQVTAGGGWSGWAGMGGAITSPPAVGLNADGRLEVFVRGTDSQLYHNWQVTAGGGWSGWMSRGGMLTGNPLVIRNADGRLEVFAAGAGGQPYHIWQVTPGGGWSGWAGMGGAITSDWGAAINHDGRLEVFARGTDNALYHNWQVRAGGGWSGWASLGGILTSAPSLCVNPDGRLEAFARGTDMALYHIWQTTAGGGWSGWGTLGGGLSGPPTVEANADGRLEVFVEGTDNGLYHTWQTRPGNGWA